MPRMRQALATVLLCFICLSTLTPQKSKKPPCSKESIGYLETLSKELDSNRLDCKLYTPTITDYEQNCPQTTLTCFAEEVRVLITELNTVKTVETVETVETFSSPLYSMLKALSRGFNPSQSECPQCECHKEEKAEKFLEDLKTILQKMNNDHC